MNRLHIIIMSYRSKKHLTWLLQESTYCVCDPWMKHATEQKVYHWHVHTIMHNTHNRTQCKCHVSATTPNIQDRKQFTIVMCQQPSTTCDRTNVHRRHVPAVAHKTYKSQLNITHLLLSTPSSLYRVLISSRLEMSWLNVSRSITRHVTPSCSSAMMLAVRKSSLLRVQRNKTHWWISSLMSDARYERFTRSQNWSEKSPDS